MIEIWDGGLGIRLSKDGESDLIYLKMLYTEDSGIQGVVADRIECDPCSSDETDTMVKMIGMFEAPEMIKRLRAFCDMYDAVCGKQQGA